MAIRALLVSITILLFVGVGVVAVSNTMNPVDDKPEDLPKRAPYEGCTLFRGVENAHIMPIGTKAPDFTMKAFEGKSIRLYDELEKKDFALVEMFASWCPHCQHSVPSLKKLSKEHQDDLAMLAVNAGDRPGKPSTSGEFKKEYKITYPILEGASGELLNAYCLYGFPTFYLLNKEGVVVWYHSGSFTEKERAVLDGVMKGETFVDTPIAVQENPSATAKPKS